MKKEENLLKTSTHTHTEKRDSSRNMMKEKGGKKKGKS
jgi:hypothetical protein